MKGHNTFFTKNIALSSLSFERVETTATERERKRERERVRERESTWEEYGDRRKITILALSF